MASICDYDKSELLVWVLNVQNSSFEQYVDNLNSLKWILFPPSELSLNFILKEFIQM